jgi:hypothetical protein
MTDTTNVERVQLLGMLGIAAATGAVFWIAEGFEAAVPPFLLVAAFAALVHFGRRRSGTIEVMSGLGDERTRSLYTRAVAFAGTVMALVLPGAWLVTVARGDESDTLALMCAVFAFAFVGAVLVLSRRG